MQREEEIFVEDTIVYFDWPDNYEECGFNLEHFDLERAMYVATGEEPDSELAPQDYAVLAFLAAVVTAYCIRDCQSYLPGLRKFTKTKSSDVDPVTLIDAMAQDKILGFIRKNRPHDGILAEEGDHNQAGRVQWIIDPIDGTVNYIYGQPHSAVSIAVAVDGEVVAGCVVNTTTMEVFLAAKKRGAYYLTPGEVDVRKLKVNVESKLSRCLIATGFSYDPQWRRHQAECLTAVLQAARDIRRNGSAALDLCALAAGRVDAYYEHGLNPWDYAAGALIASEAGASVSTPGLHASGKEGRLLWACIPSISRQFAQLRRQLPEKLSEG